MDVNTEIGKTYAVTSPNDCLVSDADFQTIIRVTAGTQAYFVATTEKVIVPDTAKVTPFKGALGLAASAGGGGGAGGGITVDQTYSATSTNPQSGTAVKQAVDEAKAYHDSHTTQKVDLGELPAVEYEEDGETLIQPVRIKLEYYEGVTAWEIGYVDNLSYHYDFRAFPDVQVFFRTGDTVPTVTWDTNNGYFDIPLHWLNTEARNVAPKLEPNTSYHLGVSYEFRHYVVSVTYEESTLEEEVSDE